jgi:hypothetical protein
VGREFETRFLDVKYIYLGILKAYVCCGGFSKISKILRAQFETNIFYKLIPEAPLDEF